MNATEIIKEVARRNGASESEVRLEIEKAIDIAWRNNKELWNDKFYINKRPSAEDFLVLILSNIKNRNMDI